MFGTSRGEQLPRCTQEPWLNDSNRRGCPWSLALLLRKRSIGGRSFWKVNFSVQTAAGVGHGTEFVTSDKGYLLMFVLGGPDLASLGEIEKSLQSLHFLEASN